ncbi:sigma-70 family RNA polymerase sigma factor [Permianibacter sp. IMCC34836]|nr:sigma-70 family RNA polymerase sigma factor [Permianibacter fluminis]
MSLDTRQAFAALLERHRKIVFKVANSYAWQPDDRAELAQEIALQLWRAYPNYDASRRFSTWMYRIALNVAISYVREHSERRANTVALDTDLHDTADPNARDPELAQQLSTLHRVIAALDPLNRALMLLYLDEYSNREIGEVLGLSETNVSTKLSRLKQRIRSELA